MESLASEVCELYCNKMTQLILQDVSVRQAPEGTMVWPNVAIWRHACEEGIVTSDTRGGKQSYFQLETCGLIKSLKTKKGKVLQVESHSY